MSMTTSPFGTPVVQAPTAPVPVVEAAPESSKRNVIILAVVAAALALGAGAYFLLFSGGADPEVAAGPVVPRTPSVVPSAPAKPPVAPPIKKYVAAKARNPFVPLVVAPVAAAAGTSSGTTSGTTSGSSGTTSGSSGTTSGGTGTTSGSGTTSGTVSGGTSGSTTGTVPAPSATTSPTSSKPVEVSVLSVDYAKRSASIKVNRNTYDREIGETFATYFKLIGVTKGECAYVQYGDVALPMCVGQPLTLQ